MAEEGAASVTTERQVWIEKIAEYGQTSARKGHLGWQSRQGRTAGQTKVQRAGSRKSWHAERH